MGYFITSTAIVCLCSAVGACGPLPAGPPASSARPITDGTLHDGHPAVGLLQTGSSGVVGICTATLIGHRTVLTAAHCLDPDQAQYFRIGSAKYPAQRVIRHEQWDATTPSYPNDIGLVVLAAPPPVEPVFITRLAPRVDQPITLVGYGATADGVKDAGHKRIATNFIHQLSPRRFSYAGSGNGVGSTCIGDSGGPAFAEYEGHEYQIGVTSAGLSPCGTLVWDTRVDAYYDWIVRNAAGDVAAAPAPARRVRRIASAAGSCEPGASCVATEGIAPHEPDDQLQLAAANHAELAQGCSVGGGRIANRRTPLLVLLLALGLACRRRIRRASLGADDRVQ